MAVLVEARSVIVRRDAIDWAVTGGWEAFLQVVPNGTLCSDGRLARVGFMDSVEVRRFEADLEALGLIIEQKERSLDLAVVDPCTGPARPCDWLALGRLPAQDGTMIGYAQLDLPHLQASPVHSLDQVATYEGWTPALHRHVPLEQQEPLAPGRGCSAPLEPGRTWFETRSRQRG
ncbi:MAG: hypothetical protein P8M11_07620 [Planctomycetota bacterium]|nr:hypothetical protein [Planctomycetota bacterium]